MKRWIRNNKLININGWLASFRRSSVGLIGSIGRRAEHWSAGRCWGYVCTVWCGTLSGNPDVVQQTSHWIEGGKFKSCVLRFEHHRVRTRGKDIGREFSQIFDNYGFDLSYIVSVNTDTTGNINTFCCYLQTKGVIHIYCVDHNIHICAKLEYKYENIPDSENYMKLAWSLIEHFISST